MSCTDWIIKHSYSYSYKYYRATMVYLSPAVRRVDPSAAMARSVTQLEWRRSGLVTANPVFTFHTCRTRGKKLFRYFSTFTKISWKVGNMPGNSKQTNNHWTSNFLTSGIWKVNTNILFCLYYNYINWDLKGTSRCKHIHQLYLYL